ncbi:MAG: radical SAM protein [Desulfamplus sp.]|nr:radical SAM protein [Desulfamplus sp.]
MCDENFHVNAKGNPEMPGTSPGQDATTKDQLSPEKITPQIIGNGEMGGNLSPGEISPETTNNGPMGDNLFPEEIILEITNICNLRCRFCHFHGESATIRRPTGHMAPHIWKGLLDEIARWNRPCTLLTHGAGEPLLYPHLKSLLERAVDIPHITVGFMTNGMLMTPDISRMLVDLQVHSVAFSIDGVIPETHDHFRKNASLDRIESHVRFLIDEKARRNSMLPGLTFNMVAYPGIMDQEEAYVRRWIPHARSVMISKFRPVGSRMLWDPSDSPGSVIPRFAPCPLLYRQSVISIEGDVGLCCEDINLDVPAGNILEKEFLLIYNRSPVLCAYRRAHGQRDISSLDLCRDCHVWGGHVVFHRNEREMDGMTVGCHASPSGRVYGKI